MAGRIIVYCDESSKKGPHFSNFYGASIVLSEHFHAVDSALRDCYDSLGLTCEIKWNNISPSTEERFRDFADAFFNKIESGHLKTRIMFTHNLFRPVGLTDEHVRHQYFLLYYQFIKNGLGFKYYQGTHGEREIQLICDQFPHTGTQVEEFRRFLLGLNRNCFNRNGLILRNENIGEAKSHDHLILQGTDLILGAVHFKLNGLDRAIPEGKRHRGKKTRAKERVYKHILERIWRIYPNFNIGISTGDQGDFGNRWLHPYRHWKLVPKNHEIDETAVK
jgi:Protein of unknown function (DUF3800)